MGWRTDQAYEDARDADYWAWLAELPPGRRLRIRLQQIELFALVMAIPVVLLLGTIFVT